MTAPTLHTGFDHHRIGSDAPVSAGRFARWARLFAVVALLLLANFGPGSPAASAVPGLPDLGGNRGFSCDEPPNPQLPKAVLPSLLDSSSAQRPAAENASPTGYQTYGWAGLTWSTYDLGCGEDLVRAPSAVMDTKYGNQFLTIGQALTAAAFWLDDQTKTGTAAGQEGRPSALAEFDRIITSLSSAFAGIYGNWLGVGLMVAASIAAWNALRSDTAGLTKTAGIAMAAMALGALMVGAPQKAIQVTDDTLGTLITDTQDEIFSISIDDAGGTLGAGANDPKNVLLDRILLEDIKKGWFGANYEDPAHCGGAAPAEATGGQQCLWLDLRDSLAFTYAEQEEIRNNPEAADRIVTAKDQKFRNDIVKPLEEQGISYYTFQGKDSGRVGIGFMAMVKVSMPSVLWLGASLLKLLALLSVRFAILFAPVWIPIAAAHGGLLSRVMRTLAAAYMWAVVGSVLVSLYLVALVRLFVTDNGNVDGTWRLWFMVLLSVICWLILRPFKRITQTISGNRASLVSRKARSAQTMLKSAFFKGVGAAIGGPVGAGAAAAGGAGADAGRGPDSAGSDTTASGGGGHPQTRPEGRGLHDHRQTTMTKGQAQARKQRAGTDRGLHTDGGGQRFQERDARLAGIAAAASNEVLHNSGKSAKPDGAQPETEQAIEIGRTAGERFAKEDAEPVSRPQPQVGRRWDGGEGATIAPMRVYTPARGNQAVDGIVPLVSISAPSRPRHGESSSDTRSPRVWDPAPTSASTNGRADRGR